MPKNIVVFYFNWMKNEGLKVFYKAIQEGSFFTWYPSSFPFITSRVSGTGSQVTISAVELYG